MRNDLLLMNKEVLDDVRVFTSSERRVSTSGKYVPASIISSLTLYSANMGCVFLEQERCPRILHYCSKRPPR